MDLGQREYTVMLTQSGTIMSFNKLFGYEDKEVPMLEFTMDVLYRISYFI